MNIGHPVTHLKEPEGAYILRLSEFPLGVMNAVSRIASSQPGIYAWYKCYDYPRDYDNFSKRLLDDCAAPKFSPREGDIKPYYRVKISSRGDISPGKRDTIIKRMQCDKFRAHLGTSLTQLSLFQCPLYIGKSIDLQDRIRQHLSEGSPLRERLAEHSISIEKTLILIIPSEAEASEEKPDEDLYEEIFSRLLNPLFNLRIG
jgi:hypothetical protein